MIVRPGPDRIPFGRAPGGYVWHVYRVPTGELLSVAVLGPDADLGETAAAQVAEMGDAREVCVVIFDGDTGERVLLPGYRAGDRL